MIGPGLRIGDYEIVRYADRGTTSIVYEGRHAGSGRPAAVKVLNLEWSFDPVVVTRFINEAGALHGLRNARLITLFDQGRLPDERPYIILEWLPHSLKQALERASNGVSSRITAGVGAQVAEALLALHERGVIHRDLKPANLLMAEAELAGAKLKLADLGLAKLPRGMTDSPAAAAPLDIVHISTDGGDSFGTWEYMAPEQWLGSKRVDPKADVYALGVLLFEMLAGRLPFMEEHRKDWMGAHLLEPPPLDLLEDRASPAFRALIAQMLSKKVAPRPTMREAMEQLNALRSIEL